MNPQIYTEFAKLADAKWDAGHRKYSAVDLVRELRYKIALQEVKTDNQERPHDSVAPDFARKYLADNLDKAGFFKLSFRQIP